MDTTRLADLIAGKCRVRVGAVEGVLDGFTSRTMWLLVDGQRVEVAAGEVSELEPLDQQVVDAHWADVAEADRVKAEANAQARLAAALAGVSTERQREVLAAALAELDAPIS